MFGILRKREPNYDDCVRPEGHFVVPFDECKSDMAMEEYIPCDSNLSDEVSCVLTS